MVEEKDSNLRRQSRQIYSLIPLAAREPLHGVLPILFTTGAVTALEMVEGEGFEPSKAEPSDLQSDPFGHSGTLHKCEAHTNRSAGVVNPLAGFFLLKGSDLQ